MLALRPHEAAFVLIALGFVASEVVGDVGWLDRSFHAAPKLLWTLVPAIEPGWVEAAWFLVGFPLAVWALIIAAGALAGHPRGLGSLLLAATTGAAPIVAVAHAAKGVVKLMSWAGFIPGALDDPGGQDTARRIIAQPDTAPGSLVGLPVVGCVAVVALVFMAWNAWRWARQVPSGTAAARVGLAGASMLFGTALVAWVLRGS
jgi:hypothetical protein